MVDNIIRNTGIFDRYFVDKFGSSREPSWEVVKRFAPPVGVADPVLRTAAHIAFGDGITEKDTRDVVKQIPIVGRVLENWGMGGREETKSKRVHKQYYKD